MSASKIGSPFRHGNVAWLDKGAFYCGSNHPKIQEFAEAAIEAWTPTPPEGWERYPDLEAYDLPEGYWCEATGAVLEQNVSLSMYGDRWHRDSCRAFGCVPVRKTKPAVPEFFVNLGDVAWRIDTPELVAEYLAENCVPKADADEMLDALKDACNTLLEYPSKDNIRRKCNALIERMRKV